MYFRNCRLSNTWSGTSPKSAVSKHPSTVNMSNDPKHLRNLHEGTFTIFFHHSEGK